jgi:hypothetical protein
MTNQPSHRHADNIRSLIVYTTLKAAYLIMADASIITMPIGGNPAKLWDAINQFPVPPGCREAIIGGTLWLSDGSWIERSSSVMDINGWALRLCPPIPFNLLPIDRLCACGCKRKLFKANRSGWAADCYTANPEVRSRLAANRQAARARAAKAKQ